MSTTMNFKIDEKLKADFKELAESMGLTSTAMLTMFVKRAVDDQALPFYPENRFYNKMTMEVLAETEQLEVQGKLSPKTLSLDEYFGQISEEIHAGL